MAKVTIVSETTVRAPTTEEPINNMINLSSSDLKLLFANFNQKGLLFPNPKSKPQQLLQHLKSSLSQTLQLFYPLSGRLNILQHKGDDSVSFYIDCNNAGVLFVYAVAESVAINDILRAIFVPHIVQEFFPMAEMRNYESVSNPLLGIQITELSDGIFIGCTMNHAIGDGSTLWNFMNAWSEISRGLDHINKPPVFENWFRSTPIRLPASILDFSDEFTRPPAEERVFHFNNESIRRLKEKANSEAGFANGNLIISSLQSVLAHLWRGVTRSRGVDHEKETKLSFQVGLRRRLKPEIPDEYFGNAIQRAMVELKARQVVENGLGFVALQLNNLVSNYTQEKAQNDIDSWIKNPRIVMPREVERRDVLVVGSSPRFRVYENDFGWGKPAAVRSGRGNKFDGKITVFPGLDKGGMDIEVCLAPRVLESLGNDSEFMDAVTI